jgi:hypothetical protein
MTALWKFLVLLAIFLLAGYATAFLSLSQVAWNQVQVNSSLIWCEESTIQNKLYRENEVQQSSTSNTSYMFEAVNDVSHIHVKNIVNKWVMFSDDLDYEIHNKSPVKYNSWPNKWWMPGKINLDSSGPWCSALSAVLSWRERVYSHSTAVLKSATWSLKHAYLVLFSSFSAIGAELKWGVHSHKVITKSFSKWARGNASTEPCGLWHDKNSEWVWGNSSTQPCGLCHEKKSEQAGGKASNQRVLFAHIKRSFISARVLISTFDGLTLSSRMACWVRTLVIKVPLLHQTKHAVPSCSLSSMLGFSVVSISIHLLVDCWVLNCICIFLQGLPVDFQVGFNLDFWGSASSSKPFPPVDCCIHQFQNIPSLPRWLQNILWGRMVVDNIKDGQQFYIPHWQNAQAHWAQSGKFGQNLASGPASGNNLASGLAFGHNCLIKLIRFVGLIGLIGLIGRIGLINHNGLFGFSLVIPTGLIGLNGLDGLDGIINLVCLIDHVGLIGCIGLNGHNGHNCCNSLIGCIGLIGHIEHVKLICLVGLIGIGLIGHIGFNGHTGLVSLMGHIGGHISHALGFVGHTGLISLNGLNVKRPLLERYTAD